MKFKTLKIHNIASIQDATIDFNGKEFAGQDLFLICGSTGSGKTTILDAICLALFNTTPRMENSKAELINEYDNESGDLKKTDDRLHLVRKNAVEASVTLDFESDARNYTVQWRVYRSGQYNRGHENAKFKELPLEEKIKKGMNFEWTLTNEAGDVIKIPKRGDNPVEGIIKMSFNQFCKTTMLAQGEFTKFLSSKADEKAAILEKLVGTEKYAEVGCMINTTTNRIKAEVEAQRAKLNDITFLSDEDIANLRADLATLNNDIKKINAQKNDTLNKIKWIDDKTKAVDNERTTKDALERAEAALTTDEVKQNVATIEIWDSTTELRDALKVKSNCEEKAKTNEVKREKLVEDYKIATNGLLYITEIYNKLSREYTSLANTLDKEAKFQHMYDNVGVICSKNDTINDLKIKIVDSKDKISLINEKLDVSTKQQAELTSERDEAIKKLDESETTLSELKNKLAEMGADNIDKEIQNLNKQVNIVNDAVKSVKELDEKKNIFDEKIKTLKEAKAYLDQSLRAFNDSTAKAEAARSIANDSKTLYENTLASVSDHARAIRSNLKHGDKCPVCGNIVDNLLSEKELELMLQPIRQKYVEDDKSAKNLELKSNDDRANHIAAQQQLKTAEADMVSAQKRVESKTITLKYDLDKIGLVYDDTTAAQLAVLMSKYEEAERQIINRQEAIKKVRSEAESVEKEIKEVQSKVLKPIDDDLRMLSAEIEKMTNEKSKYHGQIENAEKSIINLQSEIDLMISPEWKAEDESNKYAELQKAALAYSQTKKMFDDNALAIDNINREITFINGCKETIEAQFADFISIKAASSERVPGISELWSNIRQEALMLAKEIEDNITKVDSAQAKINAFLAENTKINIGEAKVLLNVTEAEIKSIRTQVAILYQNKSNALALYNAAANQLSEFTESPLNEGETRENLQAFVMTLTVEAEEKAVKTGRIQKELENDSKKRLTKGKEKERLEEMESEYAEWKLLDKYLGSTNGKNFRNVANSFILSELLDKANAYLANISTRYELFCYPGTLTIMMRDAYQGGVERATNTLSGGESFIISLALALGLSSMQNVDFEVDTLFIDEGFGTLSPEYLDPVIYSLKRLHETYGRRVGIISHIDSLKNRIPLVIELTKKGSSSSKVEVKLY